MKNKKKKENSVTEAINQINKIREDGRMDDEEFHLLLEAIFSDEMDEEMFMIIRFMFLHRPKDNFWNEPYDGPLKPPTEVSPRIHYYDIL